MNESVSRGPGFQALDRIRQAATPEVSDIRLVVQYRATRGFDLDDGTSLLEKLSDRALTLDDARNFLRIEDHENLLRFGNKFQILDEQVLVALFREFAGYDKYLEQILDKSEINGFNKETLRTLLSESAPLVDQQPE